MRTILPAAKNFLSVLIAVAFMLPANAQLKTYNFTTCGASGRYGPSASQVTNAYTGANTLAGKVTLVNSVYQKWVVPSSGLYRLTAAGAAGGSNSNIGGRGRIVQGEVLLSAGDVLYIMVGQRGSQGNCGSAGGGGGSFVVKFNGATYTPIIVGGGGGGFLQYSIDNPIASTDGSFTTSGQNSICNTGTGGTNGNGGTGSYNGWGSGGGGYSGNGTDAANASGWGYAPSFGYSFLNGGAGGNTASGAYGGFGGGGGTHGCTGGGGGGGGYSGGGGSNQDRYPNAGGGGGSYVTGLANVSDQGYNSNAGYITITSLVIPGGALSFVRTDANNGNYVSVPHSNSLNLGTDFTIEAWVNYSGTKNTILDKGDYDYLLQLNADDANPNRIDFYNRNTGWVHSTGTVSPGVWTHVAVTLTGGVMTFYINGVASGTANVNVAQDEGPLNIGRQQPSECQCNSFNGKMDDLRIWNRALNDCEIKSTKNCELSPQQQNGLAAYYTFNQGIADSSNVSISSLKDTSGNNNNGTLVGFTLAGSSSNFVAGQVSGACGAYVPPTATITANGYTSFCNGGSVVLTANNGASYQWQKDGVDISGATGQNFTATQAGAYTVTVTNQFGCVASSSATTITILVTPTVEPITGSTSICIGGTSQLADATLNGTWSSNNSYVASVNGNGFVTANNPGTAVISYSINPPGCGVLTANTTVTVNALPVVSGISGSAKACPSSTLQLSNSTGGGVWSSSDESIATVNASGLVSTLRTGTATIRYTVTVNGCSTTQSMGLIISPITSTFTTKATCASGSTGTATVNATGGGGGGKYYGVTARQNQAQLVSIDIATGAATLIGSTGINYPLTAVAVSPSGRIFATALNYPFDLYELNPSNGTGTLIGHGNGSICSYVHGLAFDSQGVLYALDLCGGLSIINTSNASITNIVWSSNGRSGLQFDPTDGQLWVSNTNYIYKMDKNTGYTTQVGNTGFNQVSDILFDASGNLFGVSGGGNGTNQLFSINKSTGAGTAIGYTGISNIAGMGGGGTAYTYLWDNGQTTQTATGLSAGSHSVTITDGNGCTSTASTTITSQAKPTVFEVTGGGAYCSGNNGVPVGLSGSEVGINYQLKLDGNNTGGPVSGNGGAISFGTQYAAGSYTVEASNSQIICTEMMSGRATVTINQLPDLNIAYTGSNLICPASTLTLKAATGLGYTYQWRKNNSDIQGATAATYAAGSGGNYTVYITTGAGCVNNNYQPVYVDTFPVPVVNVNGSATFCAGTPRTLTATTAGNNPYTGYSWSNGQAGSSITVNTGGSYSVTATNGTCSAASVPVVLTATPNTLSLAATLVSNATCANTNDGAVSLAISGGTAPYLTGEQFDFNSGIDNARLQTRNGSFSVVNGQLVESRSYNYNWNNAVSTTRTFPMSDNFTFEGSFNFDYAADIILGFATGSTINPGDVKVGIQYNYGNVYAWRDGGNYNDNIGYVNGWYDYKIEKAGNTLKYYMRQTGSANYNEVYNTTYSGTGDAKFVVMNYDGYYNGYTTDNWTISAPPKLTGLAAGLYTYNYSDAAGCSVSTTITVPTSDAPGALKLNATVTAATCVGACNAAVQLQPTGGTAPYSYATNFDFSSGSLESLFTFPRNNPYDFSQSAGQLTSAGTGYNYWENNMYSKKTFDMSGDMTYAASFQFQNRNWGNLAYFGLASTANNVYVNSSSSYKMGFYFDNGSLYAISNDNLDYITYIGYDNWTDFKIVKTGNTAKFYTRTSGSETFNEVYSTTFYNNDGFSAVRASLTHYSYGGNYGALYSKNWAVGDAPKTTGLCAGTYTYTVFDATGCAAVATVKIVADSSLFVVTPHVTNASAQGACNGSVTLSSVPVSAALTAYTPVYSHSFNEAALDNSQFEIRNGSFSVGSGALTANTVFSYNGENNSIVSTQVLQDNGKLSFQGSFKTLNSSLSNQSIIGFATENSVYNFGQYQMGLVFNGNSVYANQSGNWYYIGSYQPDSWYDFKIVKTGSLVEYFVKPAGSVNYTLNYSTNYYGGYNRFRVGASYYQYYSDYGGFSTNNWKVTGAAPLTGLCAGNYSYEVASAEGCSQTVNFTIADHASVNLTQQHTDPTCYAGTNGSITLNATGGTAPYQYSIDGGATYTAENVFSNLAAGSYQVISKDASNTASAAQTVTLVNPQKLTVSVNASGPTTFCAGGSVVLGSSAATGNSWSTGATTQTIQVNEAGTYSVSLRDANGCTAVSAPVTVTVNAAPEATVSAEGPTTVCAGEGVTLHAPVGEGYVYQWKKDGTDIPEAINSDFNAYNSGIYSVSITNAQGCAAVSEGTSVTVNQVADHHITFDGSTTVCAGTAVTLYAATGEGYIYQWKRDGQKIPEANSAVYAATVSGNYSADITNSSGCVVGSMGVNVTVNPAPDATVTIDGPATVCAGSAVTLHAAPGYSYQWKKDGSDIAGAVNADYAATTSGSYTVAVRTAQGCSAVSTAVIVTVNQTPLVDNISGRTVICANNGTVLTASSEATAPVFNWFDAENGGNLLFTGATYATGRLSANTTYYVTVTNNEGCTSASRAVVVTVNAVPVVTTAITAVSCSGIIDGQITVTANGGSGPYSFSIDGGANAQLTNVFTGLAAGTYKVMATSADGCSSVALETVVTVAPDITRPVPVIETLPTLNGECSVTVTTIPAAMDNCSGMIIGKTTDALTYTTAGTYTIKWTYTDASGNSESQLQTVIVKDITAPIVTCPADQSLDLDANCNATLPDYTRLVTASDNCTAAASLVITQSPAAGTVVNTRGGMTVTFTVTDAEGNSNTCSIIVNKNDITAPKITCPEPITVNSAVNACGAVVAFSRPIASDNCSAVVAVVQTAGLPSGSLFPVGITTNTWTATDEAGNVSTCSHTITVLAPEVNLTGNGVTINKDDVSPSAADNTDFGTTTPNVVVSKTFTIQNTGTGELAVSSIVLSGDNAGEFTVSGISFPAVIPANAAASFTVNFSSNSTGTKTATVTVNNSDCNEASYGFAVKAQVFCIAPAIGNTNAYVQASTAANACTAVVTYPLSVSGTSPVVTYTFDGATTGTGNGTGSGQTFNKGVTHVTVTASNGCGSVSNKFDITVVDDVAPILVTKPVTLYLDATGRATLNPADADNGSHDNCSAVTFASGTAGVICATAAEGNSLTLTAPAGYVINGINFASYGTPDGSCGSFTIGGCHASNSMSIVSAMAIGQQSVTIAANNNVFGDPCGGTVKRLYVEATYSRPGISYNFDCSKLGANTATVVISDADGNTATGNVTVNVVDAIRPTVITRNIALCLDASGNASITAAQINNGSTDNCSIASYSLDKTTFNSSNVGANVVTLSVTDGSGNVGTATAIVSINALPVQYTVTGGGAYCTGAAGVTVGLSGSQTGVSYQLKRAGVNVGSALAGTGSAISFGVQSTAGIYTVSATNISTSCGSNMSGSATVAINASPVVAITPSSPAICSGGSVTLTASQSVVTSRTYTIALADLVNFPSSCGNGGYYGTSNPGFRWTDLGSGTVTNVKVQLSNGVDCNSTGFVHNAMLNSANTVATFSTSNFCNCSVRTTPYIPTFNFTPSNYVVGGLNTISFSTSTYFGVTPATTLNGAYAIVTVTYNGGSSAAINNWVWTPGGANTSAITVSPSSTTNYSVTGTDANGCTGTASTTVTVNPLPAQFTVTGGGQGCNGNAVAIGLSGSQSGVRYQLMRGATAVGSLVNGTGAAISFAAQATVATYTVVATNATTACTSNMTGSVDVTSGSTPVFTNKALTVNANTTAGTCDATVSYPLAVNSVPSPDVSYVFTGATTGSGTGTGSGAAFNRGTTHVTVTASNSCGTVSYGFDVIVTDNVNPVITIPADIAANNDVNACGATLQVEAATATDNCSVSSVTGVRNDGLALSAAYPIGTTTITWTATDASNNTASGIQKIVVTDNQPPVITCPGDINVFATSAAGARVLFTAPAGTDNCGGTVTVQTAGLQSGSVFPIGTTIITYKATDAAGLTAICSFRVNVTGIAPVIVCPVDIKVNNTPGECGAKVQFAAVETTAIPASVITYSIAPGSFFPVGTTAVTATATNAVGSSSCTFNITVVDNELPVITVANVRAVADAGVCSVSKQNAQLGMPVTSDNCAIDGITNDAPASFPVGVTKVTWTVTDVHGNSAKAEQWVTVRDLEVPVVITKTFTAQLNASGNAAVTPADVDNHSTDNCGIKTYKLDKASFDCSNIGANTVTLTITDIHGNVSSKTATVMVEDKIAPIITAVASQTFCANADGSKSYTIPVQTATDNCSVASISFAITGATVRNGSGGNASGLFNEGSSKIVWTVTDVNGNTSKDSTKVQVNTLPKASIVSSNADAFCNKVTLTASSTINPASYRWVSGASAFGTTQSVSLDLNNGDGTYSVFVTDNSTGCTSAAAATYNFQKQNLSSSYTVLTFKDAKFGKYNKVNSGSVGVMTAGREAEFKSYSSVTGTGSFVKAPQIDKNGSNITIAREVIGVATVALPTMQYNTAGTKGLPNYNANVQNATIDGNYDNLTVKKDMSVTLTGNTFGTIKLEEGASIRFTGSLLNIGTLQADKGKKNTNYSYIRFAGATSVRISSKVNIGSQVWVNPDNSQVTFYMGDLKSDEEKFTVNGGDTKFTANVYMPNGKLKVNATDAENDDHDACDHKAHTATSCKHKGHDHNDCDHRAHNAGDCTDDVYMTGLFIAETLESHGNTVIWNSFSCGAAPAVMTSVNSINASKVTEEVTTKAVTTDQDLKVTVMPNPSTTFFTLKFESRFETPLNIRVMDGAGRVVDAKSKVGANSTLQIGHNYSSGTYYAEVIQGGTRKVVQLIKARG